MVISLPETEQKVDTGPKPSVEDANQVEPRTVTAVDPDPNHEMPDQFPGDGAPWRAGLGQSGPNGAFRTRRPR